MELTDSIAGINSVITATTIVRNFRTAPRRCSNMPLCLCQTIKSTFSGGQCKKTAQHYDTNCSCYLHDHTLVGCFVPWFILHYVAVAHASHLWPELLLYHRDLLFLEIGMHVLLHCMPSNHSTHPSDCSVHNFLTGSVPLGWLLGHLGNSWCVAA